MRTYDKINLAVMFGIALVAMVAFVILLVVMK